MNQPTLLSRHIDAANLKRMLDVSCKRLLANKIILAWILKHIVVEYHNYDVSDIAKRFIPDHSILISKHPLHQDECLPDSQVIEVNTEDTSITEGTVTFDILFRALHPQTETLTTLLINVEAQDNYYPGYPLPKRAIYYCCRMLSSQYGTEFTDSHYEKLKKVYSIWLCTNPPKHSQNTITKYEITRQNILGSTHEPLQNYDLMSVIIMGLKTNLAEEHIREDITNMLSVLLSSTLSAQDKKHYLEKVFNIPMTKEISKEVDNMCNYSDGIEARGIEKGIRQGISQGISQSISNLMKNLHMTAEQAMDALSIPQDEREKYTHLA